MNQLIEKQDEIIKAKDELINNYESLIRHCDSPPADNPRFDMVLELTKKAKTIKDKIADNNKELSTLKQQIGEDTKELTISEIRDRVITGSYSITHEGMKEDAHGWEHYARRLEEMVSKGMFDHSASTTMSKYEIDFAGNVMAEVQIQDNKPTVLRAINGFGELINPEMIILNSKSEE